MPGFWVVPHHFERSHGKGRNQSKTESKAVKKVKKVHGNPELDKPPQRPLWLDTYWDGKAAALPIPLKRQIYPGTRPGFTPEQLPPPVNKVAINHLSTGDLNHGSKQHYSCIEINLGKPPHRSLLHSWNWSVFQVLFSSSSNLLFMNHFPDALIIVYTFPE